MNERVNTARSLNAARAFAADALVGTEKIITSVSLRSDDEVAVLLAAKSVRSLGYLRAVWRISEEALVGPVATLLRSQMEMLFVAAAVASDPSKLALLIESRDCDRRRSLENLMRISPEERVNALTDEYLEDELNALESTRETKPWQWAKHAGLQDEHRTAYAFLSRFVHATLGAVDDHVVRTPTGSIRINAAGDVGQLPHLVVHSARMHLSITLCMAQWAEDEGAVNRLEAMLHDERATQVSIEALANVERNVDAIVESRQRVPRSNCRD